MSEFKDGRDNYVCPNCGSLELTVPPTNMDAFIGAAALDGRMYCWKCDYEGLPIIMSDKKEYAKFKADRKKRKVQMTNSTPLGLKEYKQKKPLAAALFSFLIPGLGQVYAKRPMRGVIGFFIAVALPIFIMPAFGIPFQILNFIQGGFIFIVAADAFKVAKEYNKKIEKKE